VTRTWDPFAAVTTRTPDLPRASYRPGVTPKIEPDRPSGPEPLWILGHNTNSIEAVHAALDQGANAVEIDVTAYAHDRNALCVDHAGLLGDDPGRASAPAFERFLRDLRQVVDRRPELCMVEFDLKPPASRPELGPVLSGAIRDLLTRDTTLSVILSVADVTTSHADRPRGSSVFDRIHDDVRAREGFMIDADHDIDGVAEFFLNQQGVARFGYGNGTAVPLLDEAATVYRTPIEKACWMRAVRGAPGFVEAWTVNSVANLTCYLRLGVNGLICDPEGIARARDLLQHSELCQRHRLAVRSDDPMAPDSSAYGLTVVTTDQRLAGTDASIAFTLSGDRGSASTTVDASLHHRLESGSTTYVVLPSADLGTLRSITVQSDRSHLAPGWHLHAIVVESHRHGGKKTARFDTWIDSADRVTRELVDGGIDPTS
jgi:glycerophosphoryl diester phosphodiesterase